MSPSVVKVTARSSFVPGYMAASKPTVTANGTATTATAVARRSVLTRRGISISEIGVPMVPAPAPAFEKPRSPVSRSLSQMKYRTCAGSSRPSLARSAARDSGVAICPRMMLATSPGRMLVPMKISTDTTNSVTTPSPVRRSIAFSSVILRTIRNGSPCVGRTAAVGKKGPRGQDRAGPYHPDDGMAGLTRPSMRTRSTHRLRASRTARSGCPGSCCWRRPPRSHGRESPCRCHCG